MCRNDCSQIISGNLEKNPPTSLFAEKVSITLLALGYQASDGNITDLKEKEATCDVDRLYDLSKGQRSHAKATIVCSCSLADIKDVNACIAKNNEDTHKFLKEMKEASANAHKSMSDKISSLEKWRWMMMGAGIVLGTLGYDTIAKLLK